jgi:hypothetical protein
MAGGKLLGEIIAFPFPMGGRARRAPPWRSDLLSLANYSFAFTHVEGKIAKVCPKTAMI